jgi:hypothetical protein
MRKCDYEVGELVACQQYGLGQIIDIFQIDEFYRCVIQWFKDDIIMDYPDSYLIAFKRYLNRMLKEQNGEEQQKT